MQELKDMLVGFHNNLDQLKMNILNATAEKMIEEARPRTPKKTGELREKGWKKTDATPEKVVAYNDKEYASFINYGTVRGIKANNMLEISANLAMQDMPAIAEAEIKKAWGLVE